MVAQKQLRLLVVFTSVCVSCRSTYSRAQPAYSDEMVGLYETGFEPRGFRFCDPTEDGGVWRPVQLPKSIDFSDRPGTPTGMSAVMRYVRWRADLAPVVSGGTGNARAVIVHEVLEVRAARPGDCGWKER